MLGGLWLWHDALTECHDIVQKSPEELGGDARHAREMVSTLAFWHAIMHRREGDFSNAKYWYARCRGHSVLRLLGAQTASMAIDSIGDPLIRRVTADEWDGPAFVDLVELVHRRPTDSRHQIAVRLQQAEWQALFTCCAVAAAGEPVS